MRRSQNVHTRSCLHREPGVTICCCWIDIEPHATRSGDTIPQEGASDG